MAWSNCPGGVGSVGRSGFRFPDHPGSGPAGGCSRHAKDFLRIVAMFTASKHF